MKYPGSKRRFRVEIRVTEVSAAGEHPMQVATWRVGGKDVTPDQVSALGNLQVPAGMVIIPVTE